MRQVYALIVAPVFRRAALLEASAAEEGLETATAQDGESALAIVEVRGLPALTIVELTDAKLDGFVLLASIRDRTRRAPIIVVSASSALRESAAARRGALNIVGVHTSELTAPELRASVRGALARDTGREPTTPSERARARSERAESLVRSAGGAIPAGLQRCLDEAAVQFRVDAVLCTLNSKANETLLAVAGPRANRFVERSQAAGHGGLATPLLNDPSGSVLLLTDAAQNPDFAEHPLVREGLVRGFAGVVLESSGGAPLGTLCLVDIRPLRLDANGVMALRALASRVSGELDVLPDRARGSRETAAEPRFSIQHLAAVLDGLDQPVTLWGANDRLLAVNPAFADALALAPESLAGGRTTFADHLQRAGADAEFVDLLRLAPPPPIVLRAEVTITGARTRVFRWSTKPVLLAEGVGQLDVWLDITAERTLERFALTDSLTGLANRRGGDDAAQREASRTRRAGRPMSFLLADIDHFKRVNDSYGHAEGDRVIRDVAATLAYCLRSSDVAARWGGEEFLAVLPDADLARAQQVAERVRAAVELIVGEPLVTVSIGCAQLEANERVEAAIGRADAALYQAKAAGRNQVR